MYQSSEGSHNSFMQGGHERLGSLRHDRTRSCPHIKISNIFQISRPLYASRTCHTHLLTKVLHNLTLSWFLFGSHRDGSSDRCSSGAVWCRGELRKSRWELREFMVCISRTSFPVSKTLGRVPPPPFLTTPSHIYLCKPFGS